MANKISPAQLALARLVSQRLVDSELKSPVEVVRHMTAMQAQDFRSSLWAIGARAAASKQSDVDAAFNAGQIVRSWPMRGTLHATTAEDLWWILQLTSARTLKSITKRHGELGWDEPLLSKARDIAYKTLTGKALARDDFVQALHQGGIEMDNSRAYRIIWYLAQTATVCWGPRLGTAQALVLHDEWVKKPRRLNGDEALTEFVLRYFTAHGPATLKDFMWWTKLTTADAKIGLAEARKSLVEVECEEQTFWVAPSVLQRATEKPGPSVLVLTGFDEHLLGYQDRAHVLPAEHASRIVPGNNGVFLPTVVVDGVVAGTWKRSGAKKLKIAVRTFAALDARTSKAVTAEFERYGEFVGIPLGAVEIA